MSVHAKILQSIFFSIIFLFLIESVTAANGIELYTPYTDISVPPGESIDYTIEVINRGSTSKNVSVNILGMPKGWSYTLKSGGWTINKLSVLPDEKKTLSLNVNVPSKVDKGTYNFKIVAGNFDVLPLVVKVSEQGIHKSEFTSTQANMQGHAKSSFNFSTELKNQTGERQLYSLRSEAPRGWNVFFKPNNKQATAVEVGANSNTRIAIDVKPPHNVKAGEYKIPVYATTNSTSTKLDLEVVITGSYDLELTTPNGLVSTKITAGDQKRVELMVRNTGSSELKDIRFSATKPKNWEVTFEPDTVKTLEAGGSAQVYAFFKADDKAIPGDYVANITSRTLEASSKVAFRVSVKTPLLWGWLGIIIILATLGSVSYLFQKYGRR